MEKLKLNIKLLARLRFQQLNKFKHQRRFWLLLAETAASKPEGKPEAAGGLFSDWLFQ